MTTGLLSPYVIKSARGKSRVNAVTVVQIDNKGEDENNIGFATSTDGVTWSRHTQNPVLTVGPSGQWDSALVHEQWVMKQGNEYKMWYSGASCYPNGTIQSYSIGYATSAEGTQWTKYSGNPVLTAGSSGSWDDKQGMATNCSPNRVRLHHVPSRSIKAA